MKTRNSFVANSSSSSFLLVGFSSDQFDKLYPDCDPVEDDRFNFDTVEGEDILGYRILRFSDCSVDSEDAKSFGESITSTVTNLEELGFKNIQIYYGEGY